MHPYLWVTSASGVPLLMGFLVLIPQKLLSAQTCTSTHCMLSLSLSLTHTHSHLYTYWHKHAHAHSVKKKKAVWCSQSHSSHFHFPMFWTLKNNWTMRNRILLLVLAPFVNNKDTGTVLELFHSTAQPAFSKVPRMKNGFRAFTFLCCSVSRWARTSVKFLKAVTPHHPQPLVTCITRFCKLPKQNGNSVMYAIVAFVFFFFPLGKRWKTTERRLTCSEQGESSADNNYRSLQCKW